MFEGKTELILEDDRFRILQDTQTKRFYCQNQPGDDASQWYEVEYVAAMQKEAWDSWAFQSARDEDEFTDAIAFCQVSGEVTRDGVTWIVWFEVCDDR